MVETTKTIDNAKTKANEVFKLNNPKSHPNPQ